MKQYNVKLDDDLSAIYEDIAKSNNKPIEEALQIVLRRVIETLLNDRPRK